MASAKAFDRCTSVEGANFHYTEAGSGETVLMLHGMPTSSFLWRNVQRLLAQEYRAVALDMLGFGESDKPEYRDVSIGAQAALVARFALQLDVGPVTLVGHDFGGAVAQVVAARFPGIVSRLVLVSSVDAETWPPAILEPFRPAEASRRTTVEEVLDFLRDWIPQQVGNRTALDWTTLEGYLVPWSTPSGMGAFFKLARAIDTRILREIEPELGKLWIPSTVIWGAADRVTPPEHGERLAKALPAATFEVLSGVGHLAPEEAPAEVAGHVLSFHRRTAKYL